MKIQDILSADRVQNNVDATSKKRTLEIVSEVLETTGSYLDSMEIFTNLVKRERMGSTGLGHGVAIPHGRLAGIDAPIGTFLKLAIPVDYDSPDEKPVDLVFGMMVPVDGQAEHLELLRDVAELFSNEAICADLRAASTDEELFAILNRESDSE